MIREPAVYFGRTLAVPTGLEGKALSFLAERMLPIDNVLAAAKDMPEWNQLHVLGFLPENMEAFISRYDTALKRANSASGGYAGYYAQLDTIRHRPRWSLGRWSADLRLG